jgi:hypothetical protein
LIGGQAALQLALLYVGIPFAVLALASDAVGIIGFAKKDHRLGIGGVVGGVIFTAITVPILVSGSNSQKKARTDAMNAVDSYNDYVRGRR